MTKNLPIHTLAENTFPIVVHRIAHKNAYDFTQVHRHAYFEVLFFEQGGGTQIVDFHEFPVVKKSCYIVFPQQVHLLKRAPASSGYLIQFRKEILSETEVLLQLHKVILGSGSAIVFENDSSKFETVWNTLQMLLKASESKQPHSQGVQRHLLQALLFQLIDSHSKQGPFALGTDRQLLFNFQQNLEDRFRTHHLVRQYAETLHISEKKLKDACKKHLGLSPLQVIHNRILLEAKRSLIFEEISHKEIAYSLGFDSPASFSHFIKSKTGYSPRDLVTHLVEIHK